MKKKLTGALLSLSLAATLAACGSGDGDSAAQSPGASAGAGTGEKTKITYWTIDRQDVDYMKQLIADFSKINPDIEVEMSVMADNYTQSVDIAFASNQAPDVFRTSDFVSFVKKGYLMPLDDMISPEMKDRFSTLMVEEANMFDGKTYSLPAYGQLWRLIYNKDLFEKAGLTEPPKTIAEMVDYAKKITEANKSTGAYGFAGNFKSSTSAFNRVANPIFSLSGTSVVDGYNYKTGQFDFTVYKPLLEGLRQMKLDGSMMPGVESLDIDPLRAQFAAGKIGMYFNHSGEPGVYQNQFPTNINWGGALPPTIDGSRTGSVSVLAGHYIAMNKNTKHKEAAWKFMEYVYSFERQKTYHEKGFAISIVPDVNAAAAKPSIPGIEGFLPTKYDALYSPSPLSATEGKVEGVKAGSSIVKYMLEGGDADAILKDLTNRYNTGLQKAKEAGDTKTAANPSFDPAALQGSMAK
ncbi:MAG: transporter substrate-binding protein [Paenibacillaceae bacterium]|jgi:multiple sugar transport system substrate-binding protein|nr:transporter substrate-binding protein [Paenibacillaceae bacterium]